MEKISIIITTYKRPETLGRAIESALNQTYNNIEVIVVDDNIPGSIYAEDTKKIINKYPSVIYVKNEKNIGGALSRNVGIKKAKGKFIAFLDDDDEFLPDKVKKQYELYKKINDPNCCMIYCYGNVIGNKNIIYKRNCEGNVLYEHLLENIALTSYWFCPKKMLENVKLFDDVKCCQEGTLLVKLLNKGYSVYRVPEVLVKIYEHDNNNGSGITNINDKYIEGSKIYAQKCFDAARKLTNKENKNIKLVKYYWLFNLYYVKKDKNGKKEYLKKILDLRMINFITFKAFFKYFIHNN